VVPALIADAGDAAGSNKPCNHPRPWGYLATLGIRLGDCGCVRPLTRQCCWQRASRYQPGPWETVGECVGDQVGRGVCPVAAASEAVKHALGPRPAARRQLEHRPEAGGAAVARRPIERTRGVGDQAGIGVCPVAATTEAVKHALGPRPAARRQLEHRASPPLAPEAVPLRRRYKMNRLGSMKNQKINHQNGVPAVQPAECGTTARVVYFTR
jgi:hypothetical protein